MRRRKEVGRCSVRRGKGSVSQKNITKGRRVVGRTLEPRSPICRLSSASTVSVYRYRQYEPSLRVAVDALEVHVRDGPGCGCAAEECAESTATSLCPLPTNMRYSIRALHRIRTIRGWVPRASASSLASPTLPSTAGAVELTGTIGTIVSCVVATGEARRITTAGGATHTARRSQMDRRCDGHPSASTHAAGWR